VYYANLTACALTGQSDVIAQMFEWSWDSVAKECVHFLGPAGYGYVQGTPMDLPSFPASGLLTIP
jgi:hypothetical protein